MLEDSNPIITLINEFIAHPLLFETLEQAALLQKKGQGQSALTTLNLLLSFFKEILFKNSLTEKAIEENSINKEALVRCFQSFYAVINNIDIKYRLDFYKILEFLISYFPNKCLTEISSNIVLDIVPLNKPSALVNSTFFHQNLNLDHAEIDEITNVENLTLLCDNWHKTRSNTESINFIKVNIQLIKTEQQLFNNLLFQIAEECIQRFDILFSNVNKTDDNSNNFTEIMKKLLSTVSCWQSLRDPKGNQWQYCRRLLEILVSHWKKASHSCEFTSWLEALQKTNQIELDFYSQKSDQPYTQPLRFNGVDRLMKQRQKSIIDFKNKKPIRDIQSELSLSYREVLAEIITWAESFLGPAPEESYCFVLTGSNARGDVNLYSDIESCILVTIPSKCFALSDFSQTEIIRLKNCLGDGKGKYISLDPIFLDKIQTINLENNAWATIAFEQSEIKILKKFLNEKKENSLSTKLIYNSKKFLAYLQNLLKIVSWHNIFFMEYDAARSGFRFDGMPRIENIDGTDIEFIYDIQTALKLLVPEDGNLIGEYYALHHPIYLTGNNQLFQQFHTELVKLPNLSLTGKKHLGYHFKDYQKNSSLNSIFDRNENSISFDLKKNLLQPITLLCLDLALFYELHPNFADARDILLELSKDRLAKTFVTTAIKQINLLHQLRFDGQKDGIRSEKLRDTIAVTQENRVIIEEAYELLLQPLLRLTNWLIKEKTIPLGINPLEFPEENGQRLAVKWADHCWEQAMTKMLATSKTEIKAERGKGQNKNYLNNQFITALIDAEILNDDKTLKINVKKDYRDSQENIFPIAIKLENGNLLNLKLEFFPVAPEIALASSSFSHLLVGNGYLPRVELMRWEIEGKIYPVLISENIQGKSLHAFNTSSPKPNLSEAVASLEEEAEWSKVDERSFSQAFLVEMTTNPRYKTLSDLILVATTNPNIPLASTAMDRKFYRDNKENNAQVKDGIVETPIYCLDNMRRAMEPAVLQEFIHINPALLLHTWLDYLQKKYEEWKSLFRLDLGLNNQERYLDFINTSSHFLSEGLITHLYFKLSTVQSFLQLQVDNSPNKNGPTHLQILKISYPDLSEYCEELLEKYYSLRERLEISTKSNKLKLDKTITLPFLVNSKRHLLENINLAIIELEQAKDLYKNSNETRNTLYLKKKPSLKELSQYQILFRKLVLQQLQW